MEKKIITHRVRLGEESNCLEISAENGTWEQEINSLIEYLQLLKSKGATHIAAYFGTTEWNDEKFDTTEIEGIYREIESDKAFEQRVNELKRRQEIYDKQDIEEKRREYLKLKKIFE
jgi:hypothetical protein